MCRAFGAETVTLQLYEKCARARVSSQRSAVKLRCFSRNGIVVVCGCVGVMDGGAMYS